MYVVIVEFTVLAQHFEAFVERVGRQAEDSLELEPDCHVFDVCLSPDRKDLVLLYEIYTDRAAFDAHLASNHFHDFNAATLDWVSDKQVSTYERIEPGERN